MREFLLLIQGDGTLNFSEAEIRKRQERYIGWREELLKKGQYVWGQPLAPEGIHLKDQHTLLSDGPFLEPKEMIGGVIIIKADSMDEAQRIANSCPLLDEFEIFLRPATMEM
jgi:hypothetical protein